MIRWHSLPPCRTDFKHVWNYAQLKAGSSFGCDFAGDVAYVGKDVKGWSVGDGAAGFLRGGIPNDDNGSFQEYVRVRPELVRSSCSPHSKTCLEADIMRLMPLYKGVAHP